MDTQTKHNERVTENFTRQRGCFTPEMIDQPNRSAELKEIENILADGKELMLNRELLLETEGTGLDEIQFIERQIIERRERLKSILAKIDAEDDQAEMDKLRAASPARPRMDAEDQAIADKMFTMLPTRKH